MAKRKAHWSRFEELIKRSGGNLKALNRAELRDLGILYRQTAADLAVAREDSTSSQLAAYLNQLVTRGHNLIYLGQKHRAKGILSFYSLTWPRIFRETFPATLLAVGIFAAGMIAGWALTLRDAGFAHRFLGPQMMETIDRHQMWTHSVVAIKPLAASFITTNNLTVSFTTFALGLTLVGAMWMMLFNGLMMGVVGAATWKAGMAVSLWSFVAPHGVLELPAIFISGGAGLEIARGLLFPGMLPRGTSLAEAGSRASKLVLGAVPLLLVAGAIEGFFSPSDAPVAAKFALGSILFAALLVWLTSAVTKRSDL